MGRKEKKPKIAKEPLGGKQPRSHPVDANQSNPVWSIRLFDIDGPWGKSRVRLSEELWDVLFSKLRDYESMKWGEILQNRDYNHAVPVDQLIKQARDRLAALKQDDLDELFRLRLSGTARVWGIRDRDVLKLLWWDPDHEVCPSVKKHT